MPPNTEGSAELREAKGASVRTQVKVSYVFAPRKVVRLLPDKRGRLAIPIFYLLGKYRACVQKKHFSFCHCFIIGKRNTFFIFYRMNCICFVSYSAGILPLPLRLCF